MDLNSGEILKRYETLVKYTREEDYNIVQGALDVNKIAGSPEEAARKCFMEGTDFSEIQDNLMEMWSMNKCTLLAGHNVIFDIDFIASQIFNVTREQLFSMLGTYRYLDSMPLMILLYGHNDIKSGSSLRKYIASLNIKMSDIKGDYHGALYDAIAAGRVLARFRKILLNISIKD